MKPTILLFSVSFLVISALQVKNDNIKEEKPHNITGNAEKPDKEVKVGKEEKEEKKDKEDKKEKEDKKGKKEDGKEGDKDGGDGDDDDDDDDDDDEDEEEKKPRRGIKPVYKLVKKTLKKGRKKIYKTLDKYMMKEDLDLKLMEIAKIVCKRIDKRMDYISKILENVLGYETS
uniref:Uncharacterized protein n=1 Tax=Trichobilharzia regenti TaxID=157069 RepID=A0AA85K140_TRIRE|nr:unnamed protein product [Trichobilharzia regenti]